MKDRFQYNLMITTFTFMNHSHFVYKQLGASTRISCKYLNAKVIPTPAPEKERTSKLIKASTKFVKIVYVQ